MDNSTLRMLCRIVHFLSLFGLATWLASDTLTPSGKNLNFIGHISGLGFFISGLINYYILKKFKTDQNKATFKKWAIGVHSKLTVVLLFFSPLHRLILTDIHLLWKARVLIALLIIVASSWIRKLREDITGRDGRERPERSK